jgi:uncharacterized surface protein with fasciclin (FAS1) repeats
MNRIVSSLTSGIIAAALAIGISAAPISAAPVAAADGTIVGVAVAYESQNPGTFSTLITALQCDPSAGFVGALQSDGPFTVFAPTNAAFAKLGLNPGNVCSALPTKTLDNILAYHVVAGRELASTSIYRHWGFNTPIKMLNGKYTLPTLFGGKPRINLAKVIIPNVDASNGVIHVIDSVLVPRR